MNDLEILTDRLHELGQRAPVPATDPLLDVRRGRVALRRRHARSAAGVTTALVAVGAVAASVGWPDGAGGTEPTPAGGPTGSNASSSTPTPTATARNLCTISAGESSSPTMNPTGESVSGQPADGDFQRIRTPETTATLVAYRDAAAALLDPSGTHLDAQDNKRSDNEQSGLACDPKTGEYLTSLGTSIGWTAGGGLGVVKLEVASAQDDQEPQIVLAHDRWATYKGQLPSGVVSARAVNYTEDGGGHAVVVKRTDGLTVAVAASGRWGNNVAPGSPAATDLPTVDELLTLAASPRLAFPDPASR